MEKLIFTKSKDGELDLSEKATQPLVEKLKKEYGKSGLTVVLPAAVQDAAETKFAAAVRRLQFENPAHNFEACFREARAQFPNLFFLARCESDDRTQKPAVAEVGEGRSHG